MADMQGMDRAEGTALMVKSAAAARNRYLRALDAAAPFIHADYLRGLAEYMEACGYAAFTSSDLRALAREIDGER